LASLTFLAFRPTNLRISIIRIPGLSGLDLQGELSNRNSPFPLILITGHGDIEMAVTAIKEGAHDFIEKPFGEQLLASIEDPHAQGPRRERRALQIEWVRHRDGYEPVPRANAAPAVSSCCKAHA
jgi:FixJ family two-component response regulator